jgi:hypothetical protein
VRKQILMEWQRSEDDDDESRQCCRMWQEHDTKPHVKHISISWGTPSPLSNDGRTLPSTAPAKTFEFMLEASGVGEADVEMGRSWTQREHVPRPGGD